MHYLRVKNWEEFQHYKDRSPPWIKLHRDLLRDYEFSCLQDASKLHLMLIWLLASQMDNKIPADPDFIKCELKLKGDIDFKPLIDNGFLIDDSNTLAGCKQSAMPETEAETEAEADKVEIGVTSKEVPSTQNVKGKSNGKKTACRLPEGWRCSEELARSIADRFGLTSEQISRQQEIFIDYWSAESSAKARKLDWNAAFRVWCSRSGGDGTARVSSPTRRGGGSQGAVQLAASFEDAARQRQGVGKDDFDPLA